MTTCIDGLATTYPVHDPSGVLSPQVTPAQTQVVQYRSAVTLARYAHKIGFDECQFWGVYNENIPTGSRGLCRDIWTLAQRQDVAYYLGEAQKEIEDITRYPLQPTYVVGTITDDSHGDWRFVDQPRYPVLPLVETKWARVIEPGVRAAYLVGDGTAVNHATDPAVVTVAALAGIEASQVEIYHTGSNQRITPSQVTVSGAGVITVNIPRCRMVLPSLANNPPEGLAYTDLGNFATTVDVVVVCTDPSQQAVLVSSHQCSTTCATSGCQQYTYTGCIVVEEPDIGGIRIARGTYADGAWTGVSTCSGTYQTVQLNYLAGLTRPSQQMEEAIVRLAHSKMPTSPCGGCDPVSYMWKRDRETPDMMTRERFNCPFGMSNGAWIAYKFTQATRVQRAGVL